MRRRIFLTTIFCFFFIFTAYSKTSFTMHQDRINKYMIKYPKNWNKKQKNLKQIFFLAPKEDEEDHFRENVNILIKDLPLNSLPAHYGGLVVNQLRRRFYDFRLHLNKSIVLLKVRAFHFIYSAEFNGQIYKWSQVFFLKNKKLYIFTYTAQIREFDQYYPIFLRMLYSFRLGVYTQV